MSSSLGDLPLPPAERQGVNTSEFKMAALSAAVAIVLIAIGVLGHQDDLRILGTSLLGASTLGYGAQRTYLKAKTVV